MKVIHHKSVCTDNGVWIIEDVVVDWPEDAPLPDTGEFEPLPE